MYKFFLSRYVQNLYNFALLKMIQNKFYSDQFDQFHFQCIDLLALNHIKEHLEDVFSNVFSKY